MRVSLSVCITICAVSVSFAQTPTVVPSNTGTLMRYLGDTIWVERDTTSRRYVYRGDTIVLAMFSNGRETWSTTYSIRGDSAYFVPPTGGQPIATTASFLMQTRTHLAMNIQSNESRARMTSRIPDTKTPPRSPPTPIEYRVDASLTLMQHGDTVRYVRRSGTRLDTTAYVFTGDTTVKRIGSAPRAFGLPMVSAIQGEMYMVRNTEALQARTPGGGGAATGVNIPGRDAATGHVYAGIPGSVTVSASPTGSVTRILGDTITLEHDSTVTRTIYRGDTVTLATVIDGRVRGEAVYVVSGDSGTLIRSTGPDSAMIGSRTTARMLDFSRSSAMMTLNSADMRAQLGGSSRTTPALSPDTPQRYCVNATTEIVHVRDTVRYLRTPIGGRTDTTTFLLLPDTTVRRLSPDPRVFGLTMKNTIVGEMHMALIHESSAARTGALAATLPGATATPSCRW